MTIIIQDSTIKEIECIERKNLSLLLKEIPEPPANLFVRGNSELLRQNSENINKKFLCVVGSRETTPYGADVCRRLILGLRGYPVVIVSGLARGIDGIAHEAALEAGLETVAVLASGLDWDSIYPRQNLKLAKEIVAARGALISEKPLNHKPFNFNFPERNRIMAGLSHATLVVEASMKSGTLITARLALDYNRDVFAVPGSVWSKQSDGPHMLISNGAMLVRDSTDILHGLDLKINSDSSESADAYDSSSSQNKSRILENCTEIEKKIYTALNSPMPRTALIEKIGGDAREISVAISLLEMKRFVVEVNGFLRRS